MGRDAKDNFSFGRSQTSVNSMSQIATSIRNHSELPSSQRCVLGVCVPDLHLIFKVPRTNVLTYSQMYRHRVKLYRHELEEHFTLLELE